MINQVADKIELQAGETKLAETSAGYQYVGNSGTLTLTDRRLIWRMSWLMTPLDFLGQRKVIIPISGIEKCYSKGIALTIGTRNGEFYFYIRTRWWSWWNDKKVREWVARIEGLMVQQLQPE